jgi:hypothetical protein
MGHNHDAKNTIIDDGVAVVAALTFSLEGMIRSSIFYWFMRLPVRTC